MQAMCFSPEEAVSFTTRNLWKTPSPDSPPVRSRCRVGWEGERLRGDPRGFTLSEVMVAIGLLAVALLAVISLFTAALRLQAQLQERTEAASLGRELMERIRAAPGTVPAAPRSWYGGEMEDTPYDLGPPRFPPAPYPFHNGYSLDVELEDAPRPGMKLVRVGVRWKGGKKLAFQTFIPK